MVSAKLISAVQSNFNGAVVPSVGGAAGGSCIGCVEGECVEDARGGLWCFQCSDQRSWAGSRRKTLRDTVWTAIN